MATDFYSERYDGWRQYIKDRRKKRGWSWAETRLLGKADEASCRTFRQARVEEDDFTELSDDEWNELIDFLESEEENAEPFVLSSNENTEERYQVRQDPKTAWNCYKEKLRQKKFAPSAIHNIEEASKKILQQLDDGEQATKKTVHGLVIGNVQSGKTANMEALMSMAADAGFNLFIILSGTIESLRTQTRDRFAADVVGKKLVFIPLNHPSPSNPEHNPSVLDFSPTATARYYTVCLKNSTRLKKLLYWLNYDEQQKRKMKVLLIDDESDQASLNTKKNKDDSDAERERTAVNRRIMEIVNGNKKADSKEKIPFKAMNYIAYTATPYGNVLNENGKDSLYPSEFITVLKTPDTYFGPKQIFGDFMTGTADPLPVINEITAPLHDNRDSFADTSIIEQIKDAWENDPKGKLPEIPKSLKEAVAWFAAATAARRLWQDKRPVSMLVHHSMKTDYHISTAIAVRQWYQELPAADFIKLCRDVYIKQTKKLKRTDFQELWPTYGNKSGITLPDGIRDYPKFNEIEPFIRHIKQSGMKHITIKPDGEEMQYMDGIHLCVDNSSGETVGDLAEAQARLIYPKKTDNVCDAPAFLVVGGNTLSRGLTLDGLVCTYFSRNVSQADTLMQMARWFGYRRGYELLPRIWMTSNAMLCFEELAALDIQLREEISSRYYDNTISPADYGPMVAKTMLLAVTARNKMQGAEEHVLDFSGQHLQTFRFSCNEEKLRAAYNLADEFIEKLGAKSTAESTADKAYRVWYDVSYAVIKDKILDNDLFTFGQNRNGHEFCQEYASDTKRDASWNVILQGTKSQNSWHGVGRVTRSRFKNQLQVSGNDMFNIGTLGDPNVWKSDLPEDVLNNLSAEEKELIKQAASGKATAKIQADFRNLKSDLRKRAHLEKTPRLIIYCIDHTGKPKKKTVNREPINTAVDVIGLEIIMPESRNHFKTGYQLRQ